LTCERRIDVDVEVWYESDKFVELKVDMGESGTGAIAL
jgi:hypothetical protein